MSSAYSPRVDRERDICEDAHFIFFLFPRIFTLDINPFSFTETGSGSEHVSSGGIYHGQFLVASTKPWYRAVYITLCISRPFAEDFDAEPSSTD
jgi:hypothetical protein